MEGVGTWKGKMVTKFWSEELPARDRWLYLAADI
jgi:hypothetical protein